MLTDNQHVIVRDCFRVITAAADDAVALFSQRLEEFDRSLELSFRQAMSEQADRLSQMLTAAVERFADLEPLGPVMCDLVRRRSLYDVADRHYDMIGSALLRVLEQRLGNQFTTETKQAWATVYGLAAVAMKDVAHEALAAAWIELRGFAASEVSSTPSIEYAAVGA